MLTKKDFTSALKCLGLRNQPAIAHASLRSFGTIQGGAGTVLSALLAAIGGLMMPAFTFKTMIIPDVGPPNNGLSYGSQGDLNRMAIPFQSTMAADTMIGILAETLRNYPGAIRTTHPIFSFAGIEVNEGLAAQTLYNPFAPIAWLADQDGWALLLGVDHTVNTSIHFAEMQAGRRQFVRWSLSWNRVVECPAFPGCSDGFESIRPDLKHFSRRVRVGSSFIEAIPIQPMLHAVNLRIKNDPLTLLCQRMKCERCDAIRSLPGYQLGRQQSIQ